MNNSADEFISPPQKIALIIGVTGQDGSYLALRLLDKGYLVWGTSRDAQGNDFKNLRRLGISHRIRMLSLVTEDFRSVLVALMKSEPDEVYHLAGQSSVSLSFEQPAETIQSITFGTLNVLEACRLLKRQVKLYHAGSSECFGNTTGYPANEKTPFRPQSPYAVAKASAYWLVDNYREAYGLFACTGILFNHESPLRPERFVTQKIVSAAYRISQGSQEKLILGRLDIERDWGWAPEYVEAMWQLLQQPEPEDFVIATGQTSTLESFVNYAFTLVGLDWHEHVEQDENLFRPTDLLCSKANPSKAQDKLNWRPKYLMPEVIEGMLDGIKATQSIFTGGIP